MYLPVMEKMNHLKLLIKTIYSKSKSVTYTHSSEYNFINMYQVKTFRLSTEAANGGILSKQVFLKILQNLQEDTCARVSFLIKLPA